MLTIVWILYRLFPHFSSRKRIFFPAPARFFVSTVFQYMCLCACGLCRKSVSRLCRDTSVRTDAAPADSSLEEIFSLHLPPDIECERCSFARHLVKSFRRISSLFRVWHSCCNDIAAKFKDMDIPKVQRLIRRFSGTAARFTKAHPRCARGLSQAGLASIQQGEGDVSTGHMRLMGGAIPQ